MSILDKTNDQLFDFDDVDLEIEEILEEEDNLKKYKNRYADQFPKVLDWTFHEDSPLTKLIEEFDAKFDVVPSYEFLLRKAIMEMFEYGLDVNDIYGEVNTVISEIQSFSDEDEFVD